MIPADVFDLQRKEVARVLADLQHRPNSVRAQTYRSFEMLLEQKIHQVLDVCLMPDNTPPPLRCKAYRRAAVRFVVTAGAGDPDLDDVAHQAAWTVTVKQLPAGLRAEVHQHVVQGMVRLTETSADIVMRLATGLLLAGQSG